MKQGKKSNSFLMWLGVLAAVLVFVVPKLLPSEVIPDGSSSKSSQNKVAKFETISFNAGHFEHTNEHVWLKKPNPLVKLYGYIKDNPNKNVKMVFTTYYPKSYKGKRKFIRKVYFEKATSNLTHTFLETNVSEIFEKLSIRVLKEESKKPDARFKFPN
jgi:hypothetical protein